MISQRIDTVSPEPRPGITFRETLAGGFSLNASEPETGRGRGEEEGHRLRIQAEVEIRDVDRFLADARHGAAVAARVAFPPSGGEVPATGTLQLLSDGGQPETRWIVYDLGLEHGGRRYRLVARKEIRDDPGPDLWLDATTAAARLHEGDDESGRVAGAGVLTLGSADMLQLLASLRVTGAASPRAQADALARFGKFFLGELWDTYGIMAGRGPAPASGQARAERDPECPPTPQDETPAELDFHRRDKMVDWLNPVQLANTGLQAVTAAVFGVYADKREIQAALQKPAPEAQYDRDLSGHRELWVDYIADLGDGFHPTYAMAWLLSRKWLRLRGEKTAGREEVLSPRARVLVMGGDQVYPTATRSEYHDRMEGPYRAAFPYVAEEPPEILAIPGNHDWYDGLTSFTRLFCQNRWIGGWKTVQRRSYFALKLPNNWWLWGTDVQLESDIDKPQLDFFQAVAGRMKKEAAEAGDAEPRLILVTAQPSWVYCAPRNADTKTPGGRPRARLLVDPAAFQNLAYFEEKVVHANGLRLAVTLSGDLHHYTRYQESGEIPGNTREKRKGSEEIRERREDDPTAHQRITAGGGGAYLYATHHMPREIELDERWRRARYRLRETYPDTATSRKLSWSSLLLPFRNRWFSLLIGCLYLILAWIVQSGSRSLFRGEGPHSFMDAVTAEGATIGSSLPLYGKVLLQNPGSFVFAALIVFGLYGFCAAQKKLTRWVVGVTHGLLHVLLAFFLIYGFAHLNLVQFDFHTASGWHSMVFLAEMVVGGGLAGATLFALYLLVTSGIAGFHLNEVFSSQAIEDYKNFLRLHIDAEGTLRIYPVRVDKVPRRWALNREAVNGEPWWNPEEAGPGWVEKEGEVAVDLIEPPIVVR